MSNENRFKVLEDTEDENLSESNIVMNDNYANDTVKSINIDAIVHDTDISVKVVNIMKKNAEKNELKDENKNSEDVTSNVKVSEETNVSVDALCQFYIPANKNSIKGEK